MTISYKNLVLYSTVLFYAVFNNSNCMNYNNNQQLFNDINTNNNSSNIDNKGLHQSDSKIKDFYSNNDKIKNYLKSKITNVSNNENGIGLNTNTINKFDWELFSYNIRNSASARSNLQILLKYFSNTGTNLEALDNIIYYYFNISNKIRNYYIIENKTKELLCIIFYYYLTLMENEEVDKLDSIQSSLNLENIPSKILDEYYDNIYLPRRKKQNYKYKTLDGITAEELDKAVNLAQEIDLVKILKNIVIGINIGEALFNEENINEISGIKKPLFLGNGYNQCWFRSTLQLLNSAIELCSEEIKNKLKSNTEYILVNFLEYLKNESSKMFNNGLYVNNRVELRGISFYNAFSKFENNLSNDVKKARNNIKSIKEAKQILKYFNNNKIVSNISIALPVLAKLFPEIKYLFPEEQLSKGMEILDKYIKQISNNDSNIKTVFKHENSKQTNIYFPYRICDDTCNAEYKPIPLEYYSKPYFFIVDDNDYAKVSLKKQIKTHQYRIGFDSNYNIFVYTLKGLQLSNMIEPISDWHVWSHVALDNTSNGWYFNDSLGVYSNPKHLLNMFDADSNELNYITNRVVYAFMYRKINNNETLKYMS